MGKYLKESTARYDVSWRRPGCAADKCMILPGKEYPIIYHDPDVHEEYGKNLQQYGPASDIPDLIETGPLRIYMKQWRVTLNGTRIHLTTVEMRLLMYLARRIGEVCSHKDIVLSAWGDAYFAEYKYTNRHNVDPMGHIIRVNISRIRSKLGDAKYLLSTAPGIGYQLLCEEPTCTS